MAGEDRQNPGRRGLIGAPSDTKPGRSRSRAFSWRFVELRDDDRSAAARCPRFASFGRLDLATLFTSGASAHPIGLKSCAGVSKAS
jgi:hypothetical protein